MASLVADVAVLCPSPGLLFVAWGVSGAVSKSTNPRASELHSLAVDTLTALFKAKGVDPAVSRAMLAPL